MKTRWLKFLTMAVIFLIATLAVPHNSLWGFGAGRAEGQAGETCTSCINKVGFWCTTYSGSVAETSGQCKFVGSCSSNEKKLQFGQCPGSSTTTGTGSTGGSPGSCDAVCKAGGYVSGVCESGQPNEAFNIFEGNQYCGSGKQCNCYTTDKTSGTGSGTTGSSSGAACNSDKDYKCDNSNRLYSCENGNWKFEYSLGDASICRENCVTLALPAGRCDTSEVELDGQTCTSCTDIDKTWCTSKQNPSEESGRCIELPCNANEVGIDRNYNCPGFRGGVNTGGIDSASQCHNCFNRHPTGYFFCDQSSNGVFFSVLSGAGRGQCLVNTQKDSCNNQGHRVIDNSAFCPDPLSCQQQCELLVYSGGLASTIRTATAQGTLPVGDCSASPGGGFNVGLGQIGAQQVLNVRTLNGRGTAVGCSPNQYCNCYLISAGSALGLAANVNYASGTIPGTTQLPQWNDPDALQDYPQAQPNQLDCDAPSDASIIADVKPKLARAGDTITVSGEVGKISSTCVGYERTCRAIQQLRYTKSGGFFGDTYKRQPCPSNMPNVMYKVCRGEEGEDECKDWKITKIIVIAAVVAAITVCAVTGAGAAISVCTKLASKLGLTQSGTNIVQWSKVLKALTLAGAAAGSVQASICQINPSSCVNQYQQQINENPSFSVCAKEYKTQIAAAPVCAQGGNVIAYQEGRYKCQAGSCQAFADKDVEIKVYDSKGEIVAQTTTRTDATGKFDYTLTAPQLEGEYSVLIVVPGLRISTTVGSGATTTTTGTAGTGTSGGTGSGTGTGTGEGGETRQEEPVAPLVPEELG